MATKTNTTVNGKDYFRIQRVVGTKNGKPVKKSFYGRSKAEAIKKWDEYKDEQLKKKYEKFVTLDLSTFSERADTFINEVLKTSQRYAQGTITRYIYAYNTHIKESFLSSMVASKIKASDIQHFYNDLDVSKQTLGQIHKFMSAMYKWMVRNEYSHDVLSAVEIPRKPDSKRHDDIVIWSDSEIEAIQDKIGNHRLRFLVYVMLYTGARTGEAIALKYSDFDKSTLHIKRQVYEGEIKEPKANSQRDIPIHAILKKELKKHKAWHEKEMKRQGYKTDFIFTTDTGNMLDPRNVRRSLKRFYERNDIAPKHNHVYRSTFCTQLCRCGTPLEVASSLLGHKSIEVTARHYASVQPKTKEEAIMNLHYDS